jgi:hypothetical protein
MGRAFGQVRGRVVAAVGGSVGSWMANAGRDELLPLQNKEAGNRGSAADRPSDREQGSSHCHMPPKEGGRWYEQSFVCPEPL